MLAFSLTVGDLMNVARHGLDAEADMAETSAMVRVAEAIYVLALALSSALSAFPITFALLEVYYIGYKKTARPSLSRVPALRSLMTTHEKKQAPSAPRRRVKSGFRANGG